MKLHTYILIFFFFGSTLLIAQTAQEYNDFLKAGIKLSTKEIVYAQLELTPAEVESFDRVFDGYFEKRSAIAKERLPVMVDYALNAPMMNDEALNDFNNYLISTNNKLNRLNKKYYNRAKKVIPIKKATQLFLAEKYLRDEVELLMFEGVFRF